MLDKEDLRIISEVHRQGLREQSRITEDSTLSTMQTQSSNEATLPSGARDLAEIQGLRGTGSNQAESGEPILVSSRMFRTGIGRNRG